MIVMAIGAQRNRLFGRNPNIFRPRVIDEVRDMRSGGHHLLAVDDQHALGHEAGAKRHDERLDAKKRDADPIDQADGDADCESVKNRARLRRATNASP